MAGYYNYEYITPDSNVISTLYSPTITDCYNSCKDTLNCHKGIYSPDIKSCKLIDYGGTTGGGYYNKDKISFDMINKRSDPLNIAGYDYPDNDIFTIENVDLHRCYKYCNDISNCIATVYSPNDKKCWVKSKLSHNTPNNDRILNVKRDLYEEEYYNDYPNNDILSFAPSTIVECLDKCNDISNCIVSIYSLTEECSLKSSLSTPIPIDNRFNTLIFKNFKEGKTTLDLLKNQPLAKSINREYIKNNDIINQSNTASNNAQYYLMTPEQKKQIDYSYNANKLQYQQQQHQSNQQQQSQWAPLRSMTPEQRAQINQSQKIQQSQQMHQIQQSLQPQQSQQMQQIQQSQNKLQQILQSQNKSQQKQQYQVNSDITYYIICIFILIILYSSYIIFYIFFISSR